MGSMKTRILSTCLAMCAAPLSAGTAAQLTLLDHFNAHQTTPSFPFGSLTLGADGYFYGTSQEGGANDLGTIFKVSTTGQLTVLHSFAGGTTDGSYPVSGVIIDAAGNLFGTTSYGGTFSGGLVYKLAPNGTETVLHSFGGTGDGQYPALELTADPNGNLYGVTIAGGASGDGTIFQLTSSGVETLLHSFDLTDGQSPAGQLFRDTDGKLYGTTEAGGKYKGGTVFSCDVNGNFTDLHDFGSMPNDGHFPKSGVVPGAGGYLYGTTFYGGAHKEAGTVYRIKRDGSGEALVHSFYGPDGNLANSLTVDAHGTLYGTTEKGGTQGLGVLFKMTPAGKETVLHSFAKPIGFYLSGAPAFDAAGNLYGTTDGGQGRSIRYAGTIFKITQ